MAEQNMEAKLKNLLKQEKIQLWNPPYTEDGGEQQGAQHMQELVERYAPLLCLSVSEVGGALESIRIQAVRRGKGNKTYRETHVATLELLLPRESRKDPKTKNYLETRLDVSTQEVLDRIGKDFDLRFFKLILNGKTLCPERRLDEQGVKNHSKVMVLKVSDAELKQQMREEEQKKKEQSESLQRTHKGFQILSERDGSEDTPFLEIADQRGNPLKIPPTERKALILAMGLHEKGRSLMKKKQYDSALCHLLKADQQFSVCDSSLLRCVDNFAVLQLDIVWCYRALEALSCLDDGRTRLQRAEDGFCQCYGQQRERLLLIQGNTGREEVLFLRLYLLQCLLFYIEGNDAQAQHQLTKVESLFARLCLDSDKMAQLMALGFTEREARLGLRACGGDLQEAAAHITNRRQEREELKWQERQKRRKRTEDITVLTELGFSRRDAAAALHRANGDVNRACEILQDASQAAQATNDNEASTASPEKVNQLQYLGFDREASEAALRLTGGDVQSAAQLLLDNNGFLSPPSTSASPNSEEPSTSSSSTSSPSKEDEQLVSEVLEDLSHHEDDYLDLTLEEESDLINTMKTYLNRVSTHTV
uniref:NEDD8 ultimate buster 1 n=1 Tax=Solea senegalensis TaxID=28829 RepID=UPI001CD87956|nr:NEDD8 ultimate buster 1 [Solea senegalensis]